MVIYFGADHRGVRLKDIVKDFVRDQGYEVIDLGAAEVQSEDDYPDYAKAVCDKVTLDPLQARGILVCGSGAGMCIAANRYQNLRAAVGYQPDQVYAVRREDDANILCLAADFSVADDEAKNLVKVFLATPFAEEERYRRRIDKVGQM